MSARVARASMGGFNRRAEWVWTSSPHPVKTMFDSADDTACRLDRNRFTYFRRTFEVATPVASARVSVSSGGRYQLYVNERLIGRGPDRCHPEFQHVDSYDISAFLHEGANVVACLVHTYGEDMSWYVRPPMLQRETFGCGGFFLQGDVLFQDGGDCVSLDTGSGEWQCLPSEAWNPDTAVSGPGFAEEFSFTVEPAGWRSTEFDDTDWLVPIVQTAVLRLGGTTYRPFPRMVIPQAAKLTDDDPVRPTSLRVGHSDPGGEGLEGFRAEGAAVPTDGWVSVESRSATDSEVAIYLLDFGRTEIGHIFFEVEGSAGQRVRYSYSERLAPNGSALLLDAIPSISTSPVHTVDLKDGRQRFEQFDAAGGRYVELHVTLNGRQLKLVDAGIIPTRYPVVETGQFDCSDPALVEVWTAAALTVRLCRQDGFIDCPHREQRQWTGDAHVQASFGYMTHNDPRPAERMLRQVAETQRGDGMVMMATVSDLSATGKLFIPDFCLWWVLAMESHLLYTGRTEVLTEVLPAAVRALRWFVDFVDEDGLLCNVPGWNFIDWSMELDRNGEVTALNALYVAAVRSLCGVADHLGLENLTRELLPIAENIADAINRHLYDPSRGLYADARNRGDLSPRFSQQANSVVIAFGIAPRERSTAIAQIISNPQTLTLARAWAEDCDRAFDPSTQIIMAQPFFSHFVHLAYAVTGKLDPMLAAIRESWLPMARRNGTIWEHWQDTPMTSLCHAFSATPLYDLPTHVVGIRPTKPGFAEFRVKPGLGDLQWASATMPTPHGDVEARWEVLEHGDLRLTLTVPQGTAAVIEPPAGFTGATERGPGEHELTYHAGG